MHLLYAKTMYMVYTWQNLRVCNFYKTDFLYNGFIVSSKYVGCYISVTS